MSVQVRNAVMDDMSGCRLCLDAVAQEGRWLSRLRAAPLERYAAFWASLREARAPQTVAVDGEAVVGWCDIIPDASPVRAHVGSLGMGLLAQRQVDTMKDYWLCGGGATHTRLEARRGLPRQHPHGPQYRDPLRSASHQLRA